MKLTDDRENKVSSTPQFAPCFELTSQILQE